MKRVEDILKERWTADISVEDWRTHDHQLGIDGYINAASGQAATIDRPIAELSICPKCGGAMVYRPRFRSNPRSYLAFAVCEPCNVATAF